MFEQKEIASIILIVAISFTLSFFLAGIVISTPEDRSESIVEVEEFEEAFESPDPRIFNDMAINPTEDISIGDADRANPFSEEQEE